MLDERGRFANWGSRGRTGARLGFELTAAHPGTSSPPRGPDGTCRRPGAPRGAGRGRPPTLTHSTLGLAPRRAGPARRGRAGRSRGYTGPGSIGAAQGRRVAGAPSVTPKTRGALPRLFKPTGASAPRQGLSFGESPMRLPWRKSVLSRRGEPQTNLVPGGRPAGGAPADPAPERSPVWFRRGRPVAGPLGPLGRALPQRSRRPGRRTRRQDHPEVGLGRAERALNAGGSGSPGRPSRPPGHPVFVDKVASRGYP